MVRKFAGGENKGALRGVVCGIRVGGLESAWDRGQEAGGGVGVGWALIVERRSQSPWGWGWRGNL